MTTQVRTRTDTGLATRVLLVCAAVALGGVAAVLGLMFEAKIVLGLLLGLCFGTLILLHPPIGVIFLIVTMPVLNIFPPTFFGSGIANPTNLVLGWVAFSIALHRIFVLRVGLSSRPVLAPVLAYAAMLVLSMLLGMRTEANVATFADLVRTYLNGAFLFFLAANVIDDLKHARWVFWAVLGVVVMTALWGLFEYRNDLAAGLTADRVRISGRVGQPNSFGAYLAMYLPFVMAAARLPNLSRLFRIFFVGGAAMCFFALLLTQSRGAYLGVIGGLLYLGFMTNRKLLIIFVAAGALYPLWLPSQVIERVEMTFAPEGKFDNSTETRLDFYRFGVDLWKEQPIWGHGFGAFHRLTKARGISEKERAAHSLYVQMLAETGILGIGTLFVMLGYFFRRAWKFWRSTESIFMRRFAEAYIACVIALVLVNAFGVRFYNFLEIGYFWILSALLLRFTEPMVRGASREVRAIEEAA